MQVPLCDVCSAPTVSRALRRQLESRSMNKSSTHTTPKRHHYVPYWYLKRFVDRSGFLHVYDKKDAVYARRKPREVMAINRYYRQAWAPKAADPDVVEKLVGRWLEPRAREIF